MPDLAPALTAFLDAAATTDVTWMLVGSMATRLHGARITPGDVDILVHPDTEDGPLWDLARRLCAATPDAMPGGGDPGTFRSTAAEPLLTAGDWTFGRWFVTGGKLEVARIREDVDAGLLENHGRRTWQHRRTVHWHGRDVPVVPLEVQWATMAYRHQHDRMHAVTAGLPRDWDEDLARQALRDRGIDQDGAGKWALP